MTNKVYKVYIAPFTGESEMVVASSYTQMEKKVAIWIEKKNKTAKENGWNDEWKEISDVQMVGEITIE